MKWNQLSECSNRLNIVPLLASVISLPGFPGIGNVPGSMRVSVYEGKETVAQWIEHGPRHQEAAETNVIKGTDVRQTLMSPSTERKPACPQREEQGGQDLRDNWRGRQKATTHHPWMWGFYFKCRGKY